jgi:hypothetical protein
MKISISEYGNGYQWEQNDGDEIRRYRTNEQGRGLWVEGVNLNGEGTGKWSQVVGTGQFALPAGRAAAAAKIRRAAAREYQA